jgi:predicted DNA-binding transcriptional regulator AlpA
VIDRFIRKNEIIAASGLGRSVWHQAVADGSFPPPDCYLSPRVPVWKESTLFQWQAEQIAACAGRIGAEPEALRRAREEKQAGGGA